MYVLKIHIKQNINYKWAIIGNTFYSKAFNKYSNDMDDIYKNIKGYNPYKNENYWSYLMM